MNAGINNYLAHIKTDAQGDKIEQSCQTHCNNTADYAGNALAGVGLKKTAYLSGLLHDIGKFTEAYQTYLEKAASGMDVKRGSVNHTFAGVRYILKKYHSDNTDTVRMLTSELIAFSIGSHHGLFDCVSDSHENGFRHRMTKEGISYKEALSNCFNYYLSEKTIDNLFDVCASETETVLNTIQEIIPEAEREKNSIDETMQEFSFYIGLLSRLILSAVVEGDRRDTSEFFIGQVHAEQNTSKKLWRETLNEVERNLDHLSVDSSIGKARKQLSNLCKESATKKSGIYRLNMPTGSGKTLSSLRYALTHAERWDKKRILFVTPLLSILDQNAAVIRDFVNNDSIILEHHSNVIRPQEGTEDYDIWEYCTETWHSPIIITTMVQFLDTLFSGKMSAVRRMHSLCESIIVIDEVQTVPVKMLSLFNSALNFLQSVCKATIVLSSATQPNFDKAHYPLRNVLGEIVQCSSETRQVFERTNINQIGSCTLAESVLLIENTIKDCNSLLVVCNKKKESQYLYTRLKKDNIDIFHLSASMCICHRMNVLDLMKSALNHIQVTGRKVVCISTQVIEAGVDISFEKAIRFAAGMDSVIQTAGRCNRNREVGSDKKGDVFILSCLDENLNKLDEIKKARMATEDLLAEFTRCSSSYHDQLDSKAAIDYYYKKYFGSFAKGYQDYALYGSETLYNLLSQNTNYVGSHEENCSFYLRQAFSKAGSGFKVFDTDSIDVIVPYGNGKDLINALNSDKANWDIGYVMQLLEDAKQYTVALYSYQIKKLEDMGGLYKIHDDRVTVLQQLYYNDDIGVVEEDSNYGYLGV